MKIIAIRCRLFEVNFLMLLKTKYAALIQTIHINRKKKLQIEILCCVVFCGNGQIYVNYQMHTKKSTWFFNAIYSPIIFEFLRIPFAQFISVAEQSNSSFYFTQYFYEIPFNTHAYNQCENEIEFEKKSNNNNGKTFIHWSTRSKKSTPTNTFDRDNQSKRYLCLRILWVYLLSMRKNGELATF